MRSLGEEQRQKTDQLLFTAPVKVGRIVLGKFLAILTVFAAPLIILAACPLVLSLYGAVPLKESYSCFLAFFFMGAACIAIGIFISSITESQIIAAVGTFAIMLCSYLINGMSGLIGIQAIHSLAGFGAVIVACSDDKKPVHGHPDGQRMRSGAGGVLSAGQFLV